MFGTWFYHQRLRKSVAAFGTLFNNIYIIRQGGATQMKVPLAYAPKRKFLDRIRENPDLDANTKVAIKLPRMSFEIISIQYDATRQLQKTNTFQQNATATATADSFRNRFYTFVPYNVGFQLSVYAKTQDDCLQIVEQILPTFNPQYTLTIKPFGSQFPNVKEDIPIALTGVDFADDYESPMEQRRTIIYSLTFDMRVNFYGPIAESRIIRTANTNLYEINRGLADSDLQVAALRSKPNPFDITGDSDFGFNDSTDESFIFNFDSS